MIEKTGSHVASPAAVAPTTAEREKLLEVAGQFEALMLSSMMKSMRATLSGDTLTGSTQQDMYQEMMDKEMVESIVSGAGLGLKQILAQQLSAATAHGAASQSESQSTSFKAESAPLGANSALEFNNPTSGLELMSRLRVTLAGESGDASNATNTRR